MKRRIFTAMCIIAMVSIILTAFFMTVLSYRQFQNGLKQELQNETVYVAAAMAEEGESFLTQLETEAHKNRITLIDTDGTVIYDNEAVANKMENHSDREEVQEALEYGVGESTRLSDTLGQQTYYYAVSLNDGTVLRLAATGDSVYSALWSMLPWIIVLAVVIAAFAFWLSRRQTHWILAPVNTLDLDHPVENDVYEELSPLLTKIHHQKEDLRGQMEQMHRNQEEFAAITENMSEGLIVIGADKHILSVNHSALKLLGAKGDHYEGAHILELNRNLSLQKVADQALEGVSSEETFTRGELICRLHASPVRTESEDAVKGAIILVLDVTESQKTERLRREFSANVSHELKTPLTAISGYAEMMQNGMVKEGDFVSFSGRIYEEAQRLIALIDDVMEISRLDEKNSDYLWETVDLYGAAQTVMERLTPTAQDHEIQLKLEGGKAEIQAVPRLIDELIYNLVENAIKYSNGPSDVVVTVEKDENSAVLTVKDRGIGIPQEYQSRVFERFFRVDQSHSRDENGTAGAGGTGLGLAIVKHVVSYHHGHISLESGEGTGTKITVAFPL